MMKKFWKGLMIGTAVLMMATGLFACKRGNPQEGVNNDSTVGGGTGDITDPGTGDGTDTPEAKELHFGSDPFDGTWNETVPGIGLMLYCDATDQNGNRIEDISTVGKKVTFTVEEGATAAGAAVRATSGQQYFVATGAGKATVRVTVKDGEETIDSTKEITVAEVGSGKTYENFTAFGQSVYGGKLNINLDADATAGEPAETGRKGLVITKNGLFVNRGRDITATGTVGLLYCGDLGDNFEVTMDVTVRHIADSDSWNSLIFKFWTGKGIGSDGEAGNWYVNWNGGWKEAKLGANKDGTALGASSSLDDNDRKDKVEAGKMFTLKLSRAVAGGKATLKMEYTMNGTDYTTLLSIASNVSEAAGNAGANVVNVVVQHSFAAAGSLEIGNIVKTKK